MAPLGDVDAMCADKCRGHFISDVFPPKFLTCLLMRKHQTNPHWETVYKIPTHLTSAIPKGQHHETKGKIQKLSDWERGGRYDDWLMWNPGQEKRGHQWKTWGNLRKAWSFVKSNVSGRASQLALVVKNPPANAGDVRRCRRCSIPGSGRAPGWGHGNAPQYSCLGNPMDRGAWQATVHRVAKN